MRDREHVECSKCEKLFPRGTLSTEFRGFGRKLQIPKGWHSASEVKRVTFAIEKPVCVPCGGEKKEIPYEVPLWKRAKEAWNTVEGPEMQKLRGKRGG
jgi:hypothetical protein